MLKKIFGLGSEEDKKDEQQEIESQEVEKQTEDNEEDSKSIFGRLKEGLSKTRDGFVSQVESLFRSYDKINEELYEDLEEILIQADVGVKTTMKLVDDIKEKAREEKIKDPDKLINILREDILDMLNQSVEDDEQKTILMVVGVNGAGKTTTIGKIAQRAKQNDKRVLLAAGDTFRAAAIEQLEVWANKVGTSVISHQEGADSAAVAYDAVQSAKSKEADLLIVDTAGRLHTQSNLMDELKKVKRVIEKEAGAMKVEVLLVLDATTGQNAVSQAKLFNEAVDVDGIALTKLDGTAKGGVVIAIRDELDLPINLIGVGEDLEDLQDFEADSFVDALFDF